MTRRQVSTSRKGWERPIGYDFYRDPNGVWIYKWSEERITLTPETVAAYFEGICGAETRDANYNPTFCTLEKGHSWEHMEDGPNGYVRWSDENPPLPQYQLHGGRDVNPTVGGFESSSTSSAGRDTHPPKMAVDADGYCWRVYPTHWSMCPVNPDNEPVPDPVTFYVPEPEIESLFSALASVEMLNEGAEDAMKRWAASGEHHDAHKALRIQVDNTRKVIEAALRREGDESNEASRKGAANE